MRTGPLKYAPEGAVVNFGWYGSPGGGIAITLTTVGGEPYGTATVNLPDVPLTGPSVWMKGWGENEGLPAALEACGVLRLTGVKTPVGFCEAELGILTPATIATIEKKGVKL